MWCMSVRTLEGHVHSLSCFWRVGVNGIAGQEDPLLSTKVIPYSLANLEIPFMISYPRKGSASYALFI